MEKEKGVESAKEIATGIAYSVIYTVMPFLVICFGLTHMIAPEIRLKWADSIAVTLAFAIAVRGLYKDDRPIMRAINLNAIGAFAVINFIYFLHSSEDIRSYATSIVASFGFLIGAFICDLLISRKDSYNQRHSLILLAHLLFATCVTTVSALSLFST